MKPTLYDQILAYYGGVANLANKLIGPEGDTGISVQAIYLWKGVIPLCRAFEIQVITEGRFTAKAIIKAYQKQQETIA